MNGDVRRLRRRQRRQAGFNLVEVMVALVVLTLAVVGAASLQTATTRANIATRNRTHAMEFLQTWVERVKMDGMAWQSTNATPDLFAANANDAWFRPDEASLNGVGFMQADFWGTEVSEVDTDAIRYCAELRGELLTAGTLRADVRVWWHREGSSTFQGTFTQTGADGTTESVTGPIDSDRNRYAGCDYGGDDIESDPRIYSITASTTLVALN